MAAAIMKVPALDAVWDDAMLGAGEVCQRLQCGFRGAVAFDFCAHLDEQFSAINHFRFAGGADQARFHHPPARLRTLR